MIFEKVHYITCGSYWIQWQNLLQDVWPDNWVYGWWSVRYIPILPALLQCQDCPCHRVWQQSRLHHLCILPTQHSCHWLMTEVGYTQLLMKLSWNCEWCQVECIANTRWPGPGHVHLTTAAGNTSVSKLQFLLFLQQETFSLYQLFI